MGTKCPQNGAPNKMYIAKIHLSCTCRVGSYTSYRDSGNSDRQLPSCNDLFPRRYARTSTIPASSQKSLCQGRALKKSWRLSSFASSGISGGPDRLAMMAGKSSATRNPKCGGYVLGGYPVLGEFNPNRMDAYYVLCGWAGYPQTRSKTSEYTIILSVDCGA